MVQDYLDMGVSCNFIYRDTQYRTLLNYLLSYTALEDNEFKILMSILEYGADIQMRDENGRTPLMNLAENKHITESRRDTVISLLGLETFQKATPTKSFS